MDPAGSVCTQRSRFRRGRDEIAALCGSAAEDGAWKIAELVVRPAIRCDNGVLHTGAALTCHGSGGTTRGGPPMRGTHGAPALASYRDAVADRLRAGERFGAVEDAIDEVTDLTQDEKAALWLYAFSLRPRSEQQYDARAHLAFLY